jgi:hypothetical protein
MNAPLVRLNPTRLTRWLRCEYEGYAYSELGIYKQQTVPSPHRDRGKVFHALLEHALRHYADTNTVFQYDRLTAREVFKQQYRDEGTDVAEETGEQLLAATNYHIKNLDLPAWEIVKLPDGSPLIETDLRAPLIEHVELQAKIDIAMRHRVSGKLWLIDWKTTALVIDTLLVPPFIEHNYQLAIQREVLRHNGIDVDLSALCHLRSQAPEKPPLVYAGKKNQRTSYDTTKMLCDWPTYRAALVERGEDPSNAAALKVKETLAHQVFTRWQVDMSSDVGHAATMHEITRAAKRMVEIAKGDAKPIRRLLQTPRSGCTRCDYEPWCRAAMRNGGEPDLRLLGTDYLTRDTSVLAGHEHYGPQFHAYKAYVEFAAKHGRTIDPHTEFTPCGS